MERVSFLFKKRIIVYIVGVILVIVVSIFLFKNKNIGQENLVIQKSDFVNQVSISGKVVASDEVNLSFKNGGRIENIYFNVNQSTGNTQEVKAGTLIAQIDAKDARKAVSDASIALESAKLSLEKLKVQNSNENMNADLQKAYDDGFIEVSDSFLDLSSTIIGMDDLLSNDILSDNAARNSGKTAINYRNEADKLYYKAKTAFENNRNTFRTINRDSSSVEIEKVINETYNTTKIFMDSINSLKNFVDYLSNESNNGTEFLSSKNTLYEYTNTINAHLSSLLSIKTSVKTNKDAFSNTNLDTQSLILNIKQRESSLSDALSRLEDYFIRAPFSGIITKVDAKVGELASPNIPLVTMMSSGTFQIESYVPEVNISKIKLGDEADISLDAYGSDVIFKANVVSIDPAETIKDGVSTYKVKLQFLDKDERVKSGMTANISINIFSKPNTIVVPGGVIFEKNNQKFVQIKENGKIVDVLVETGSVSTLGQVEIIKGIKEGDIIILNPVTK